MFILICALYVSYECVCVCVGFLLPLHVGVRVNTCTDMIVSVNKMQCFDKVCVCGGGGDGRRITMGQDAKAVSNHLMEVMAGRNKSMTNSLLPGNANHTLSHSVYS